MNLFEQLKQPVHRFRKKLKTRSFHRELLKPGDLVFDIGANVGQRSKVYLELGAKVIAVEPQASCVQILKKEFAENPNVVILKKAVSDKTGSAEIFIANNNQVSTLSKEFISAYKKYDYLSWNETEKVEVTTLDDLIAEFGKPDYIKIDVEGFELKVLTGLSTAIKLISFEYNQPFKNKAVECIELLSGKFDCFYNFIKYEDMNFEFENWMSHGGFINYLSHLDDLVLTGEIFTEMKIRV